MIALVNTYNHRTIGYFYLNCLDIEIKLLSWIRNNLYRIDISLEGREDLEFSISEDKTQVFVKEKGSSFDGLIIDICDLNKVAIDLS